MTTRVAYLINHYPKVSHTFIRREILALEKRGLTVERIALRGWNDTIVDPADKEELARTRYVLKGGVPSLVWAAVKTLAKNPRRFVDALVLAIRMGLRGDRPLPYHLIYLAEACRILQWLRVARIDHIHAHFGTNSAEVAMLAHVLGIASYSVTMHGPEEFDKPEFLGIGEKTRRAAFVVAISSFARGQLFRHIEYAHWPKVEVVHCGLDADFYEIEPVNVPAVPRLVCVGRLSAEKGQLLLVEAAHRLAQENIDFEIVLAGDGEARSRVEELISRYRIERNVRITGWISSDRVRKEILSSRALVLPSFAEGLPVVIMEAMALRRPVLTTYVAGIPELVQDGVHGWLFPSGSVDDLARCLKECLSSPTDRLMRMGEAAHQRVLARHNVDSEAGKLAELFRQRC